EQMVQPAGLAQELIDALTALGTDVVGDRHRRGQHDDGAQLMPDVVPQPPAPERGVTRFGLPRLGTVRPGTHAVPVDHEWTPVRRPAPSPTFALHGDGVQPMRRTKPGCDRMWPVDCAE